MLSTLFGGPWGPLLIFLLRVVDVSMTTTRTLLSMRNARLVVPLIGFFESAIWLLAAGIAIRYLDSPLHVLGYAAGFATGTAAGLWIEERLAFGLSTVQLISQHGGVEVAEALREAGFGVTEFAGQGREGMVEVVQTVVMRRQVPRVLEIVDLWDPEAFVSVEEPRTVRRGWMFARRRKP
jgi:uncharacterized protein YebE (UPF0316 family)